MNKPDTETLRRIDGWTRSAESFALYRLPWTDECHLVKQTSGEAEPLDDIAQLNGRTGFVIAPFRPSASHPLVLIRPDVRATGWDEIQKATFSEEENDVLQGGKRCVAPENPSPTDEARYAEVFGRFITPLKEGTFQKLVLSRTSTRMLPDGFSPLTAFVQACNNYPRMMIYLCHTPLTGTWIGSTPEILLSGQGEAWHTVALAGTMPMQGEEMPDGWTPKNREEQALVADYVRGIVKRHSKKIEEKGPYTARAGQLVHLKTDFRFRLKGTRTLGNLLKELHPTPAVCGLPKAEAYTFINANEGYDRRYYSGFIGWLAPEEQTDIYVNLRCMEIHAHEATLYAGGGILPSSEKHLEWEETNEKNEDNEQYYIESPCHSERSEESESINKAALLDRFFTSFRMTIIY